MNSFVSTASTSGRRGPGPAPERADTRSSMPWLPHAATLVAAALLAGCTMAAQAPEGPGDGAAVSLTKILTSARVLDLTHELSPDSLYWPTGTPFQYEHLQWGPNEEGNWYAAGRFSSPEHLGTHLDAPIHFFQQGWSSDEIPPDRFLAPAVVVDISDRADADPDATLQAADLEDWEQRHGAVPAGAIVIVRTGWSSRWPDWNAYYGSDDPFDTTTLHFPGVSPQGAAALIQRGVVGVGIDTASIDPGNDLRFRAHRALGQAGLFNLENLMGLDALPEAGAVLLALPMKIQGGSGGPTRVLALVPQSP